MLSLKERRPDGSIVQTLGTMTVISPDGLAVTALHCVLWDDALLYPEALWVHSDACRLAHVASYPPLDVSVWRLSLDDKLSSDDDTSRLSGGFEEKRNYGSSSGGGNPGSASRVAWPHVAPFSQPISRIQQGST